ncbi:hypothetical protein [Crenobacter caeni]|uniref:Uncharacterized protein n=1 Tax=Crenobacter caeni TaxID=2705474 RepID=A0A6B2KPN7_9NEIS|nr:hypothetical protein [Crenobacter caeni]NDV11929.1 hypothetical protein [Crenobacter caeni]
MKPHPRNARIKGDPFIPSRFIFGDAVDDKGLEPCEYIVHTEEPAFICRLVGHDDTPFAGRDNEAYASAVLFDDEENITVYVCNKGFRLFDFNFWDEPPTAAQLQRICDEAITVYDRLNQAYQERDTNPPAREMRVVPTEPLPPAERQAAIQDLMAKAREAAAQPMARVQLAASVQLALQGGDQAVFTEAQLGLQGEAAARAQLVDTARKLIANPEVIRKDGSFASFELWAMPIAFSRAKGGVWWHFPLMERVEVALADALEVPEKAILWMSPTLFTLDMLNERACQSLIHLAPIMDAGCDIAPEDPEAARATFEAANQTGDAQLVIAWIPFIVERGVLDAQAVRQKARKALDATMPLVQQAISNEMEYGEAELFAPLPIWEALEAGVRAWNRKRLGLTVAVAAAGLAHLRDLEAVAEYQPELQGYEIALKARGGEAIARTPWLVVPDVASDRQACWQDLAECMQEAGIALTEQQTRWH